MVNEPIVTSLSCISINRYNRLRWRDSASLQGARHWRGRSHSAPRNWASVVLEYNLLAESMSGGTMGPHLVGVDISELSEFDSQIAASTTPGSCLYCLGAATFNSPSEAPDYQVSYYLIAHLSKYVRPGSQRIRSYVNENEPDNAVDTDLPNVAFLSADGNSVILVIYNSTSDTKSFNINIGDGFNSSLPPGSAATYVYDLSM